MNNIFKSVKFYVGLVFAIIAVVAGVIYKIGFGHIESANSIPFVLLISAAVLYLVLSLLGQNEIGAAFLGLLSFAAMIFLINNIAPYVVDTLMGSAMTEGISISLIMELPVIIEDAVLMIICAIAGNVIAWIKRKSKNKFSA